MIKIWNFYDFVNNRGRNVIWEWLISLPEEAQIKIHDRIRNMEVMAKWQEKWASDYKGLKGIYELRIPANRVQYRPLGTYLGEKKFVILAGAIEKGGKIPKGDLQKAQDRLKMLKMDASYATPHQFYPD